MMTINIIKMCTITIELVKKNIPHTCIKSAFIYIPAMLCLYKYKMMFASQKNILMPIWKKRAHLKFWTILVCSCIEKEKKIEIPTTLKISDNNIILLNIFYCVVFHQLSFLIYKCIFHVVFSQKKNNIIIQCMYNVVLCMFYMSLHKFFF